MTIKKPTLMEVVDLADELGLTMEEVDSIIYSNDIEMGSVISYMIEQSIKAILYFRLKIP